MSLWKRIQSHFGLSRSNPTDAYIYDAQRIIGYTFADIDLLRLALTHRSVAHVANQSIPSNERLEFLGDSVLGLIIAEQLYRDHPELSEGDLTKTKAMLVNEATLAARAIDIGLNLCVQLSSEEEKSGGRERPSIISDACESVIGAVYLDGGIEAARNVILRLIYRHRDVITSDVNQRNYKGELLELIQGRGEGMPRYEVISERGPDHAKEFEVVVCVGDEQLGLGEGTSKKEAEQKAAAIALEKLDDQSSSTDES
jgi:ribonuclease-3